MVINTRCLQLEEQDFGYVFVDHGYRPTCQVILSTVLQKHVCHKMLNRVNLKKKKKNVISDTNRNFTFVWYYIVDMWKFCVSTILWITSSKVLAQKPFCCGEEKIMIRLKIHRFRNKILARKVGMSWWTNKPISCYYTRRKRNDVFANNNPFCGAIPANRSL